MMAETRSKAQVLSDEERARLEVPKNRRGRRKNASLRRRQVKGSDKILEERERG